MGEAEYQEIGELWRDETKRQACRGWEKVTCMLFKRENELW